MTQESPRISTSTSNSGDKGTTSPMMRCWGMDHGGMTDIAIVSSLNEDGIRVSRRLPNSRGRSSASRGTPWNPMRIRRGQASGRSVVAQHRMLGNESQNRKLLNDLLERSPIVWNGYTPRDLDSQLMSEVLSRRLSITSDITDLSLSRRYELETWHRSRPSGKPMFNPSRRVSGYDESLNGNSLLLNNTF
jgi:hypothetical protein